MREVCFSISQTFVWCRLGVPQSSVLMTASPVSHENARVCAEVCRLPACVCTSHAGGWHLSSLVGADGIPVVTMSHACVEVGEIHTEGVLGDRVFLKSCSAHCRSAPRE